VPRKKLVRGDKVEDAVRKASRPFATTQDIAEALDVSTQAVRNNEEELASYSGLETGKVGRSRVYWLAENGVPEQAEPDPEPPAGDSRSREFDTEPTETEESESESGLLDKLGLRSDETDSAPAVTEANRLRYRAAVLGEFSALVMLAAAGWLAIGSLSFFAVGWGPLWLFVHPALFLLGSSVIALLASVIGIVYAPWAVSTVERVTPDVRTEETET